MQRKIASDITKFSSVEEVVTCLRERDASARNVKESGQSGSKNEAKQLGRRKEASASNSRNKVSKLCHVGIHYHIYMFLVRCRHELKHFKRMCKCNNYVKFLAVVVCLLL